MTRRWSGQWAERPADAGAGSGSGPSPAVDVLIPSCGRAAELAVTLAGLAAQDGPDFRVIVSDQTEDAPAWEHPAVKAVLRILRTQGRPVRLEWHLPRRGMAEQRHFLLQRARAPWVLYLDNDIWLEPWMLARMTGAIAEEGCGFIGAAVQGLSFLDDERPDEQQTFELWQGPVEPERIRRDDPRFDRWPLHNAANLAHVAARLQIPEGQWRLYKVAWVGGCVLYDRKKLLDVGGFGFWEQLPAAHAGEDVAAQWRVMERYGGAGMIPSGAVHLESATTVPDRSTNAADVVLG